MNNMNFDKLLSKYISVWIWSILFGAATALTYTIIASRPFDRWGPLTIVFIYIYVLFIICLMVVWLNLYKYLIKYIDEANFALSKLYAKEGDNYFLEENCQSALESYETALEYYYSNDINSKKNNAQLCVEELQLYQQIKTKKNKNDCISYINRFPQGKYFSEVKKILQSINEEEEWQLYYKIKSEEDKVDCNTYLRNYPNGKYNNEVKAIFEKILKKEAKDGQIAKQKAWNNGFKSAVFYSYTFQPSPITNTSHLHGLTISVLRNTKVGYYMSFRANKQFFYQKINLSERNNNLNYETAIMDSCISSAAFSVGITKKIYRPLFFSAGVNAGMNTISKKHNVIYETEKYPQWLYFNENRNFYLSPEIGLSVAFWVVS